jgi:hypothetical protein
VRSNHASVPRASFDHRIASLARSSGPSRTGRARGHRRHLGQARGDVQRAEAAPRALFQRRRQQAVQAKR